MLTSILALLASVVPISAVASQTPLPVDAFEPETGAEILILGDPSIPVWMPGFLRVHFEFQSDLMNSGGGYLEPDVKVSYSVRPTTVTAAECTSLEVTWVHGQEGRWPEVEVLTFSAATGAGVAQALLPINIFDEFGTWGRLWLDNDVVKVFWGWHAGDLIHPGTFEPAAFEGVKSLVFDTHSDEYFCLILQNRMMLAGEPATVRFCARDISTEARTFDVYSEVANLFSCPATITLPAQDRFVEFTVTPQELGSGRLAFAPQGPSPATYSQVGHVKRGKEGWPWDGGDPYEEPGLPNTPIRMNSDCHHAKVVAGVPSGAAKQVCGTCKQGGNHSTQECFSGGGVGDMCYYVIPFFCDWWALFDNCVHDPNGTAFSVQGFALESEWIEECGTQTTDKGVNLKDLLHYQETNVVIMKRQCCKIEATSNTKTITVNDCD